MKNILILIIIGFALNVCGQNSAKEILASYVNYMGQLELPEKGKTYYLNMTIKNEYNESFQGPSGFTIEAFLSKNQMRYNSNIVNLIQDTSEVIAIVHSNRQIYISNVNPKQKNEEQRKKITGMQLEIIKTGKITNVEKDKNTTDYQVITMIPQPQFAKNTGIENIMFHYNEKDHRIKTVRIIFDNQQKIKSQEYNYNAIDFNYKAVEKEIPVRSYIYSKSGKLLDKYRGYQIIDNRS